MSVETNNQDTNNQELEELKQYATDIGMVFRDNIGLAKLKEKVEAYEIELAEAKKAERAKAEKVKSKKVKIVVEPREKQDGVVDQFFGLYSQKAKINENIKILFGEEVEVSEAMYEHIKSITNYVKKQKIEEDEYGNPKTVWYNKKQTRFIVSKID